MPGNTDGPKDELFKLGLNEDSELNSLISYYRHRIARFEQERFETIKQIERIKISVEEKHRQEWELERSKEIVAELQKSQSDSRTKLYDERQITLKQKAENDTLAQKTTDDYKKINDLIGIVQPVSQNIVLQKDKMPDVVTKFINNDLNINFHKKGHESRLNHKTMDKKSFKKATNTVYKTVFLNGEDVNAKEDSQTLSNENQSGSQVDSYFEAENRKVLLEHVYFLREELEKRERESSTTLKDFSRKIQELTEKNQRLEKVQCDLNKEYFLQRVKFEELETKVQEENQLLRLKNSSIATELYDLKRSTDQEVKVHKDLVEKKSQEYTSKYRNQISQKEDTLQVVKDQYSKVQQIYNDKVKTLEETLIELKSRYNDLKKKKNLEISGYKSEVKALRQEFKRLVRDIEDQRYNESPINATKKVLPKNTRPKTATVKVLKKKKELDPYKNGKKPIFYQDSDEVEEDQDGEDESVQLGEIEDLKKKISNVNDRLNNDKNNSP